MDTMMTKITAVLLLSYLTFDIAGKIVNKPAIAIKLYL